MDAAASRLVRDMGAILCAAVVLGCAYNALSPLGIRSVGDAHAPAAAIPRFTNETIALTTELGPPPRRAPALRNATLTLQVENDAGTATAPVALPTRVTWPQAKALLAAGRAVLVDARDAAAFAVGHIPGAISLPFTQLSSHIAGFSAQYPPATTVIVYCASTQCPVSAAEAVELRQHYGYTDVRDFPGGYAEWLAQQSTALAHP